MNLPFAYDLFEDVSTRPEVFNPPSQLDVSVQALRARCYGSHALKKLPTPFLNRRAPLNFFFICPTARPLHFPPRTFSFDSIFHQSVFWFQWYAYSSDRGPMQ